jgi:hypothetical protein
VLMKHTIQVDVVRPDGIVESFLCVTDVDGRFSFKYIPTISGVHRVKSNYLYSSGTTAFRVIDAPPVINPMKKVRNKRSVIIEYILYILYTISIGTVIFLYFKSIGIL